MSNLDLKPGDMIEWVYAPNKKSVDHDQNLWSSTMNEWVTIGKPSLLISIDNETYSWLNGEGIFHARVNDWRGCRRGRPFDKILQRKCE